MKKVLIALGMALLFYTGCATTVEKSGKDIDGEPSKIIKAGVTTKEEIIKIFGEPSSSSVKDGSEELVYESTKKETPTYLGGLVISEAGREVTIKRLNIVIRDGVVQSYRYEVKGE